MELVKLLIVIVYAFPVNIYSLQCTASVINKSIYPQQDKLCSNAQNDVECNENRPHVWCLHLGYRKEIQPWEYKHLSTSSLPWNYHLYFDIIDIHEINEIEQTIKFGMYFSVAWHEPRLRVNKSAKEWSLKMNYPFQH